MPGLSEIFTGKPLNIQQIPTINPQQQGVQSQLLQQLGPLLQQSAGGFKGIADESRRQFREQGIPSIMERLTSLGGGRSSAVAQQLGGAQAGFESQLAGQEGQFNNQLLQLLLSSGLQPTTENIIEPEQQGLLQQLLTALAGGAGLAGGLYGGRAVGSGISALGGMFKSALSG